EFGGPVRVDELALLGRRRGHRRREWPGTPMMPLRHGVPVRIDKRGRPRLLEQGWLRAGGLWCLFLGFGSIKELRVAVLSWCTADLRGGAQRHDRPLGRVICPR